jgi:hypothetical protein
MQEPKSTGMPLLAVIALASLAFAAPLSAQQSGRMQVHATVVDVSSSLDVIATLRQRVVQTNRPAVTYHATGSGQKARSWFMVAEKRAVPMAAPQEDALALAQRGVTVFYY